MRCSSVKAAAVALLSMGGSLLGAHGIPTGSNGPDVAPNESMLERAHRPADAGHLPTEDRGPKSPEDPFKSPYTYTWPQVRKEMGVDAYDIFSSQDHNGLRKIDAFGKDLGLGRFYVFEAFNAYDQSKDRLKSRELFMGAWVHLFGQQPSGFRSVYCYEVDKAGGQLSNQIDKAYDKMGKDASKKGTLTVRKDGTLDGEKDAFEAIMEDNAISVGIKNMLEEYMDDDRKVETIVIKNHGGKHQWDVEYLFY
ncbi:Uu.00g053420.m01.CDS01 [Anthostomella pinea]|uniref:Uu.00g053420.m01.CDS01 n=1 Tax=Anthostomella pinea TaxID=933095 RepID=A0AAI8VWG1_9PEZI|nr:Uu.00g053420.m01.CDS01 [Anthostomella pinea]